jgi:hypothetical protein
MHDPNTVSSTAPLTSENRGMVWVMIGALVIGAFAYFASSSIGVHGGRGMGGNSMLGDFEVYYSIKAVLANVNAFLLVSLSVIYVWVYRETGLEFSLGMVVFSVALLFYALVSNPLLVRYAGFIGSGLGSFAMLPDLFTCIASITLLYISR